MNYCKTVMFLYKSSAEICIIQMVERMYIVRIVYIKGAFPESITLDTKMKLHRQYFRYHLCMNTISSWIIDDFETFNNLFYLSEKSFEVEPTSSIFPF